MIEAVNKCDNESMNLERAALQADLSVMYVKVSRKSGIIATPNRILVDPSILHNN
jgi:hypothetical protein